jgi:phosphate starvation-inducible membrane PsiE
LIDHQAVEGERVSLDWELGQNFIFPSIFQIDMLLQQPALVANIVALLKSDSIRSLTGALRTVGNVITGTDEQTTAILDYGVLQDLVNFFSFYFDLISIIFRVFSSTPVCIKYLANVFG